MVTDVVHCETPSGFDLIGLKSHLRKQQQKQAAMFTARCKTATEVF
jgi:hypothetical protein